WSSDVCSSDLELQEPLGLDVPDVAGAQPAVVKGVRVVDPVVGAGDPRAADLQLAHGFAVPRHLLAGVVDDPGLDAREQPPLGLAELELLLLGQVRPGP